MSYTTDNYMTDGGDTLVIGGSYQLPNIETVTEDFTLTEADSGKTFIINATDLVATLPATQAGLVFTFYVATASAVTGFSISPQAADKFILGAKADDEDLVNTAASDAPGNSVIVMGDGANGWLVLNAEGTWA